MLPFRPRLHANFRSTTHLGGALPRPFTPNATRGVVVRFILEGVVRRVRVVFMLFPNHVVLLTVQPSHPTPRGSADRVLRDAVCLHDMFGFR